MRHYITRTLVVFLILALSPVVQGQIKVGEVKEVRISTDHPYTVARDSGYVFKKEFHSENSAYIRLYFENFQLAEGDYMVIFTPERADDKVVYAGGGKKVSGGRTISKFWARSIKDDHVIVKLYSTGGKSQYGFDITKVAYGYSEGKIDSLLSRDRSICGNNDKEEISCYSDERYNKAQAVSRLLEGGNAYCTGWLLGNEGHLMTNNHCIGNQTDADNTEFQFNYQYNNCDGSDPSNANIVAQSADLKCTDSNLDFTLVKLPNNPTDQYGYLSLSSDPPNVGDRIYIPQHPGGKRKKIAVNSDNPNDPGYATIQGTGNRVEYYADTEGGSSGSPVISHDSHLVYAIHNTGGCTNGSDGQSDRLIDYMKNNGCLPDGGVDDSGNLLKADFSIDAKKSCDSTVSFSDQSTNATNYDWDFGDGASSSLQSPSHTYDQSGTYTVTLIVDDGQGNADTATADVKVVLMEAPASSDETLCKGDSTTLDASGSGDLVWYDAQSGGNRLGTGPSFTTPVLNTSTDYYVENIESTTIEKVGEPDTNLGGGRHFKASDNWGLNFDVENPVLLRSVRVYSDSSADRKILLSQGGTGLDSTVVNIGVGTERIDLGFEIPAGQNYLLKVKGDAVNLYRNNGGATYPYGVPNLISITGNNTGVSDAADYYYYFYDWEVREKPCRSERTRVQAEVIDGPAVAMSKNDASCKGDCDGSATADASGGSGNYSYKWDDPDGQTTKTADSLCPGTYTVTVTDQQGGCATIDTVTVGDAGDAPTVTTTKSNASCGSSCDGSATADASGGSGSYSYQWDDPDNQTTKTADSLCAGTYTVTVTDDQNGCSETDTVTIPKDNSLTLTNNTTDVTCRGDCDGKASVNASGGNGNYSYQWDDPDNQKSQTATGLCAGTYTVTVTDGNGCSSEDTVSVTEPDQALGLATTNDTADPNNCDGELTANATGGVPSYSYQWNDPNGQTSQTASGLCPGTFTVVVTDANGCKDTAEATVHLSIGLEEEGKRALGVKAYPVPANKQLNLELPAAYQDGKVRITVHNVMGEQLDVVKGKIGTKWMELDASSYPEGVYFIGIHHGGEVTWKRVPVIH